MPEVIEVECMGRQLATWLVGAPLVQVRPLSEGVLRGWGDEASAEVVGVTVVGVHRRGKVLWLALGNGGGFVIHFGMTGRVLCAQPVLRPWVHLILEVEGRSPVWWQDMRRLGSWRFVRGVASPEAILSREVNGRDVLSSPPDGADLARLLGASRRPIKVALMDQDKLAGLGNIYAVESLFEAGIHPRRPCHRLSAPEWEKLARVIPRVLAVSLAREEGGEILYVNEGGHSSPFAIYGHAGSPCPRCGARLQKGVLAGRGTVWCGVCQPEVGS